MLGDLNIAEPKALIGFAGPRVIEQTIRQKLPENFQTAEFLLDHGMLDAVVDRRQMRDWIVSALNFTYNPEGRLKPFRVELPSGNGVGALNNTRPESPAEDRAQKPEVKTDVQG
jgi:hypothetical protein